MLFVFEASSERSEVIERRSPNCSNFQVFFCVFLRLQVKEACWDDLWEFENGARFCRASNETTKRSLLRRFMGMRKKQAIFRLWGNREFPNALVWPTCVCVLFFFCFRDFVTFPETFSELLYLKTYSNDRYNFSTTIAARLRGKMWLEKIIETTNSKTFRQHGFSAKKVWFSGMKFLGYSSLFWTFSVALFGPKYDDALLATLRVCFSLLLLGRKLGEWSNNWHKTGFFGIQNFNYGNLRLRKNLLSKLKTAFAEKFPYATQ